MDETTNEAVVAEETTPVEEVEAEGLSDAEFDSLWDEEDGGDYGFESDSEEADQQTEEQVEEATEPTETEQSDTESPDQDYLELKHLDEVKKVSKDEAKVLAQKGLDYDRIRTQRDEASANVQKLQKYEEFLNEIKGDFDSIEDLMNDTRARLTMDKEGITYDKALEKVKTATKPKETENVEDVLLQIRRASVEEFAQSHPNLQPQDIPQEVWDDVLKTNNLEASYAKYEAKKLREENETLKKNAKNKSRSTGSMKSSGNASYEKSEFDRVMEEDDW